MSAVSVDVTRRTSSGPAPILRKIWHNYVLRRLLRAIFVVWLVATATFFLLRLIPGNPVEVYINTQIAEYGMSYQDAAAAAASLFSFDPSTPVLLQYWEYLKGLLQGDMGNSILSPGTTVTEKILDKLPWTLFSTGVAIAIAIAIGLVLGMIMAYRRGGFIDHAVSSLGSVLHAIPNYLLAIMIVVIFAVQLEWINLTQARGHVTAGVSWETHGFAFISDIFFHATLPMITYILTTVGGWALVMKFSTTQVLGEDYVTVAQARGLPESRIRFGYVGRNAVLPLVAQIAVAVGSVVGGAIFVEQTFSYDGLGVLLFQSLGARDYPVIQGILLVITTTVIAANLIADLIYGLLDPRITIGEEAS
jgi:peptide/nickel transport system permease protein